MKWVGAIILFLLILLATRQGIRIFNRWMDKHFL